MWQHWLDTSEQWLDQMRVIVFVKAPRLGFVKTRLAEGLGKQGALDAYKHLLERLLEELAPFPFVELKFAPADAEEELRSYLRSGWKLSPQCEGDLGEKLTHAFAEAFDEGASRVVIIGSDCPYVTKVHLLTALTSALDDANVSIGPSRDGGYWLVGLKAPCSELFQDITWSTEKVLKETLNKAECAGKKVFMLEELEDIDTVEEWKRYGE